MVEKKWNPDDWETPDSVAAFMATLVQEGEYALEPFAGTGQIAKFLRRENTVVNEINSDRLTKLRELYPDASGYDFLDLTSPLWEHDFHGAKLDFYSDKFDVVITNPPFSRIIQSIEYGLKALDKNCKDARLLYLMPTDWDQSQKRWAGFNGLDCHIHHLYKIVGHVAYLKDGVAYKSRQIHDAVWDIRPGRRVSAVSYIKSK